ncbi:type III pantothenate kinase [Pigmentiphaga soli]|uniref:Type III pantothenate kinase n=1 Tax=Pigmentiphaga soli TaxID=1007095 RepID=A0ABP8HBZ4_9BURK
MSAGNRPSAALLLIDAGNSRVKLGWRLDRPYADAASPREAEQASFGHDQASAMAAWLDALPAAPRAALGTNVAGPAAAQRLAALLAPRGCAVRWVGASAQLLGLRNGYREPERLGADRWFAMAGIWQRARHRADPASLLAHFGTATTLDTIDAGGRFIGGLILPGGELMRRALAAGTAGLPDAAGRIAGFPDHTHDAIVSGIAAAQAGALLRQWLTVRERVGGEPQVYAAGGAWPALAQEAQRLLRAAGSTKMPVVVDNPVLDGLACLAAAEAGAGAGAKASTPDAAV